MRKQLVSFLFLLSIVAVSARAQDVALKTNLLYDATSTMNIGAEIGLSRKLTLDISGNLNPWVFNKNTNSKIQHILIQPEIRYWLCERFNGHFFGAHAHWGNYNAGAIDLPFGLTENTLTKYRYRGNLYGFGVGYGYQWVFRSRWAVEAELGVGYTYFKYDRYECRNCGKFTGNNKSNYLGPTKLAVSLIYIIE